MQILDNWNWVSKVHNEHWKCVYEFRKSDNDYWMTEINQHQRYSDVSRLYKLLQKIHSRLLLCYHTVNRLFTQSKKEKKKETDQADIEWKDSRCFQTFQTVLS